MQDENVHLTEGFFQELFEKSVTETQPILQILRSRATSTNAVCIRASLSDGIFKFTSAGFHVNLADKLAKDGLDRPVATAFPIVKVIGFVHSPEKNTFVIADYELLSLDAAAIGEPLNHTGDPEAFRGLMQQKRRKAVSVAESAPSKRVTNKTDASGMLIIPIRDLNPFIGKWKICGMCTQTDALKQINTRRGPSKVFNFELADESGGSIRLAAFSELAENLHQTIAKDATFSVTGSASNLKSANKRFNNTGHDYEVTMSADCLVEKCVNNIEKPKFTLKPVSLDSVVNHVGQSVDIIAVIDKVDPCQSGKTKEGKDYTKREVQLLDKSGTLVALTLWADHAIQFDEAETLHRVVGIKGAYVREFMGAFSLGVGNSSRMEIDPDNEATNDLLKWYESERPNLDTKTVSITRSGNNFAADARSFASLGNSTILDSSPKGVVFNAVAFIASVRQDGAIYTSCVTPNCNKKVVEVDGSYRCEKCRNVSDTCAYRYMVQMAVCDGTASHYLTLFDDKAVGFFGKTAKEMFDLQQHNSTEYAAVFNSKVFKCFQFRLRGRMDTYNDVVRPRMDVYDIRSVTYQKLDELMTSTIEKLESL